MLDFERLLSISKNETIEVAKNINSEELQQLIALLSEKDDKIRYQSFLLLQNRSSIYEDVYSFWDIFCQKLDSENSYQRSIGLMLIAENVKWDRENKFERIIDAYLKCLNDEKPITVRQCIQALQKIIPYKRELHIIIAEKLMKISISNIKETMRKLIMIDILEVLIMIRKYHKDDKIEEYIFNSLSGGILDKKAIKHIESLMK